MVNINSSNVTSYLIHVMDEHKDQQFIFAPYHEDNHWLLIVICTPSKAVYVFDLMKTQRTIEVKTFVNMAFRSIPTNGRATRNINWTECKIFEVAPYSMNEIDEVRESWAQYFIEECV
ncbi:uncharacterized protein LOC116017370 [Ipomoea triloba]|uniref:uncharacterized protein LOC116017370 n=1 Tax=Ipomoea triloba TaxID=35885 RepID=UPI00125DA7C2|nr:uncharacterized protein LOC116017370 [Ipomoea triloba]